MEADIKNVFDMINRLEVTEDGYLSMDSFRDGSAPYEKTKFGQLEDYLNTSTVLLEDISN